MARAKANGIEIEYETFGNRADPAMLLIMGLGAQLTLWPRAFCEGLAGKGYFVVRYDNRDCGLSTDFGAWGPADIAGALLDALGIDRAHIVGGSMGGMIAQTIAGLAPQRTRTLVSIFSTSGRPGLPLGKPEALAMLTAQPPGPAREQLIAHGMKVRAAIGSPGYPASEDALRELVAVNIDRRWYPEGAARQYLAIIASGNRVELLKTVKAPTLVLHGEEDPLLPVECGRDVASLVQGAGSRSIRDGGMTCRKRWCRPWSSASRHSAGKPRPGRPGERKAGKRT